jgi:hypothetical protein
MKPVVFYVGKAYFAPNNRALLVPVNHPNHLAGHVVSNGVEVITSQVIVWNHETGEIETRNTVYKPAPDILGKITATEQEIVAQ